MLEHLDILDCWNQNSELYLLKDVDQTVYRMSLSAQKKDLKVLHAPTQNKPTNSGNDLLQEQFKQKGGKGPTRHRKQGNYLLPFFKYLIFSHKPSINNQLSRIISS